MTTTTFGTYGEVEYEDGKPVCKVCGRAFHRLMTHVRQKHGLTAREYKESFGLDVGKGLCSEESAEKTSKATLANFDKCVTTNLLKKGEATRYKDGDPGRRKDKLSEQTRKALKERLKHPAMVKAMQDSGRKVGKSGLGNKKRWGEK
jgi:hypothetical protein